MVQTDSARIAALRATVPKHVAIVMDGNGRWAQRRGLKRTEGHAAGEEALFDTVEGALEIGLEWLTVYAFSTENWRRPLDEVRFLMNFNERLLVARRDELHGKGVRVRFIGRRTGRVPRRVLRRIEETEALTARNRRLTLTFAFNYGGRAELVDAVREIAREVAAGRLDPERVDERAAAPAHVRARHARSRSAGAHLGRAPDLQLSAVAGRVFGAALHRRAVARLPARAPLRRDRGIPAARTPFRRRVRVVDRRDPGSNYHCCDMPGLYRDEGVVLRAIKLGEADRIVTIFTQGHGKIRAVAKGIRKTTSKFGPGSSR